jgi:hypothetical protein
LAPAQQLPHAENDSQEDYEEKENRNQMAATQNHVAI